MAFDLSTARPVTGGFDLSTAQAAPSGATPGQASPSLIDSALRILSRVGNGVMSAGPAETVAHLGTGAVAGLGGGLNYLGTLAATGGDTDAAKAVQEATQQALTYQPRTKEGKAIADAADKALGLIPKGISTVAEGLLDNGLQDPEMAGRADLSDPNTKGTVTPGMAAAVNTAGNALMQLGGLRGLRGARAAEASAADSVPTNAPKPAPTTPAELLRQSLDNGKDVGYQTTPNYDPSASFLDRLGQGIAGKAQVEQGARVQNQAVTNALGARAVGLSPAELVTQQKLQAIRQAAVDKGYAPIQDLDGPIQADAQFLKNNEAIRSEHGDSLSGNPDVAATADLLKRASFDPAKITDQISTLRSRASDAYTAGRPSAGAAFRKQAGELEALLDRHLQDLDDVSPDLLNNYRAARQLIAKTHTIGDNLNPSTGNIDAAGIGSALRDGTPLTGSLKTIADFANSAPGITTVPNGAPLPTSPLNTLAGAAAAHSTGGASLALIPAARAFAARWLLTRNENPALLQPGTKTYGQTALDAIHGNAAAFQRIYGRSAPGALIASESSPDTKRYQ
jgi:hypothetical protein